MSMGQGSSFTRRMSAMERISYRLPNANVVMAARLSGEPDLERVNQALADFCARHPLTRVRIVLGDDDQTWFTAAGVPAPEVERLVGRGGVAVAEAVRGELVRPFDTERGPLVRVGLLGGGRGWLALVTAHHSVCDGRSLLFLLSDVFGVADGQPSGNPNGVVDPPVVREGAPVSTAPGVLARWFFRSQSRRWARRGLRFSSADAARLHAEFWRVEDSRALTWELSPGDTRAFTDACRREGVSVSCGLLAGFLRAEAEVQPESVSLHRRTILAVDQRPRLRVPAGESFGLLATGVSARFKQVRRDAFWDTCRAIKARLPKMVSDENVFASVMLDGLPGGLLDAFGFQRYGLIDDRQVAGLMRRMGRDRIRSNFLLSNLGRAASASAGRSPIDLIYGPFVYADTIEKYLGVTTWNGRMSFALCYGEGHLPTAVAARLRDRAMEELKAAI